MRPPSRGMSFIDVVVGTALILIVFLGFFGMIRASIQVASLTKAKAEASSVAESQMEYVRSLSYAQVGTVGGIPSGVIPQNATTTLNGVPFPVRTFIQYFDDPADGTGAADTNGITTDYKRIKISVSYVVAGQSRAVDLVSNYSPSGLETTTNGGTLKASIVGALGAPIPGATVRIQNSSTSPAIDVTTFSDSTGTVFLPGAAVSSQYRVSVTKPGYSSAQTYVRDSTNVNPTPGYLTVARNLTTTGTFAIDVLSALTINTFSPIATTTYYDAFANAGGIALSSNAAVAGGAVVLSGGPGNYAPAGSVVSSSTAPTYLASWSNASSSMTLPAGTDAKVHVVAGDGTLIPDSVIPGNGAGFGASVIDLSNVSTSTYPSLALSADLSTSATSTTPSLLNWGITYRRGPVPLPSVPFTLTGAKTIGTTAASAAIYKTTIASSTNASGQFAQPVEWDSYKMTIAGYDPVDACNAPPYAISPGTAMSSSLYLGPNTTNSLLVTARDNAGNAVAGATVKVTRGATTLTGTTSACGAAYFGSLTSATNYGITVSKTGYSTEAGTNVSVSGHTFYASSFN